MQFAQNQLEKGLWAATEDQAESRTLPTKHSIYLLIFWSIFDIACRCEDQYRKSIATFKEIFYRLDHAFSTSDAPRFQESAGTCCKVKQVHSPGVGSVPYRAVPLCTARREFFKNILNIYQ